ncbi:SdpI family protein [Clostridium neuense]|uniref:SdpI family protein n=1 Tax=Clostridium neuense TaxID=1728934 RepID=A0ABW8THT1_9CLOT
MEKETQGFSYLSIVFGTILSIGFFVFMYFNKNLDVSKVSLGVQVAILVFFIISNILLNIIVDKKNYGSEVEVRSFTIFLKWLMPIIYILICGFINTNSKDVTETSIFSIIGALFIILGLVLPKIQFNNAGIGIKFPWILKDKEAWDITHRKSSPFWVMGGIVSIAFGFFPKTLNAVIVYIILFFICILVCPLIISIRAHYYK